MTFKTRLTTAIATGAVLLNAMAPIALATTTIQITGNGAGSDNWTTVNQTSVTSINQTNSANVTNNVDADAKTGNNDANFNTGGTVGIMTGDAKVETNISNDLNSNAAEVDCCNAGDTNVNITGNGADSNNGVALDQSTITAVDQSNNAYVSNNVDADAKTGGNDADSNTGGDVLIRTGDASVDVNVSTNANVNMAHVGSANGSSNPSASFVISGNGAGSDNYITASLAKLTSVAQDNSAYVSNNVDADAKTGYNDANFNTGGDVLIGTGNAKVMADVNNAVNFNHADVDCGCTWDVLAKIAGNGADQDPWWWDTDSNLITLNLDSIKAIGQGNGSDLNNNLDDLTAKTGHNDVNSNTGDVEGGDPGIMTGDATVDSSVNNSGNVNVVGDMPFDFPDMPEIDFSFNFSAFWMLFGLLG